MTPNNLCRKLALRCQTVAAVLWLLALTTACGPSEPAADADAGAPANEPAQAATPETPDTTGGTPAPKPQVTATPSAPAKTETGAATTPPKASMPTPVAETAAQPAPAEATPTPNPKQPSKVVFPEMKMSDRQIAVRDLFVQAHKQFQQEDYVAALKTLENVTAMNPSEKEQQAIDLFLKRIEKALGGSAETEEKKEVQ